MLGKIAKAIADFITHKGDKVSHITSAERTAWNAKSEFTGNYEDLSGAPVVPTSLSWTGNTMALLNADGAMSVVSIPVIEPDGATPGLVTSHHLALLKFVDETELDTAVTTALSEATA